MDYRLILEEIKIFDSTSVEEIRTQILPYLSRYSTDQASEILGVSKPTIYGWTKKKNSNKPSFKDYVKIRCL